MGNANVMNFGLLIVFLGLIYFMMIRPQKKKDKADAEMRNNLKPGDEVLTVGGIKGKVLKVTEKTVTITTGADRTKIEFVKTAIGSVLNERPADSSEKVEKVEKEEEQKAPDRSKKVTPKKLSKSE